MEMIILDIEARGLIGGYKGGELICVIADNTHQVTNMVALQSLGFDLAPITQAEVDKEMEEAYNSRFNDLEIFIDDLKMEELAMDTTQKKRSGKRKNANPYQNIQPHNYARNQS